MADPARRPPAPTPREQAARWLVMLQSGPLTDAERDAFRRWLGADRAHRQAWREAEQLGVATGLIAPGAAQRLTRARAMPTRRQMLQGLGALLVGTPLLAATWHAEPWESWTADALTDVGQRRSVALPDGGSVLLNTDTAIDIEYGAHRREIYLLSGEVLVRAGTATRDARPFMVITDHGTVQGSHFMVRQHDGQSDVTALSADLIVTPVRNATVARGLATGMHTRFTATTVAAPAPADPAASAWRDGRLQARGARLADFLSDLDRHRPGVVQCAADAAELRIAGDFDLADTDAILRALPGLLPVEVRYRTPYWVSVRAA
ncbi:DUF4880 domain-containing protein [Bordetella genomosp. 5]|uniref:Iron dicitrate transport regulator FecR n=1 Tax=Bordetella genomosp. 5 TaxID=1395608 RepID=A0A261T410_9BORD|nr:DUF4880 domain-containing protein [Bordetella genomosp. 5]OZI44145.1 hypothetical protein CAL25_22660 [Bordetella genomosp. 5]